MLNNPIVKKERKEHAFIFYVSNFATGSSTQRQMFISKFLQKAQLFNIYMLNIYIHTHYRYVRQLFIVFGFSSTLGDW